MHFIHLVTYLILFKIHFKTKQNKNMKQQKIILFSQMLISMSCSVYLCISQNRPRL